MLEDGIKANQELIANADEGINLIDNLKNRSGFQIKLIEMLMESISEGVVIDSLNSTSGDSFGSVAALVYNASARQCFCGSVEREIVSYESNSGSPFDS